jgi:hypothetical protein
MKLAIALNPDYPEKLKVQSSKQQVARKVLGLLPLSFELSAFSFVRKAFSARKNTTFMT